MRNSQTIYFRFALVSFLSRRSRSFSRYSLMSLLPKAMTGAPALPLFLDLLTAQASGNHFLPFFAYRVLFINSLTTPSISLRVFTYAPRPTCMLFYNSAHMFTYIITLRLLSIVPRSLIPCHAHPSHGLTKHLLQKLPRQHLCCRATPYR